MHDITTIGSATRDIFLHSGEFKHVKDPEHLEEMGFEGGEAECIAVGSKIELEDVVMAFGGGAVNSAVTFANQGFKTRSLIKVGKDSAGDAVIEHLKDKGVTIKEVRDKNKKTAYSTILLMPGGERTILVYRGAAEKFKKREIGISKLKSHWAYVVPSRIPYTTMEWMLKAFKRRKKEIKIAMNPSHYYVKRGANKLKNILNKLDVLIMNKKEAADMLGEDYDTDGHKLLRALNKKTEAIVVITRGSKGAMVTDGRYVYEAGTYKEEKLVDRTGAGDAFGSGFVSGLIRENDISYALKLGSANATAVVEEMGAHENVLKGEPFRKKQFKYLDIDIEPLV